MIDQKELAEVQAAIDKAAPAVQAEIAELETPGRFAGQASKWSSPRRATPLHPIACTSNASAQRAVAKAFSIVGSDPATPTRARLRRGFHYAA